jgi:multimeric flavodoxin WrbA
MNSPKSIIIFGSSRSNGDTRKMVNYLMENGNFDLIDLNTKNIDYLRSPTYWYLMSAILKTFFDRIIDLLQTRKETGRKLRTMNMVMLSCSMEDDRIETFDSVFVESAGYLGIKYLGDLHTWLENGEIPEGVANGLNGLILKINK